MKKLDVKKLFKIMGVMVIPIIVVGIVLYKVNVYDKNIDVILKTDAYSYLSPAGQDYVRKVYEESGTLILTEKNKQENVPYLNPLYVEYLDLSDEEKENIDLLPNTYVVDFIANSYYKENEFPEIYNLTDVDGSNYTTPMKDQGNLGLCWSFASIEQAESYLMVTNNKPYDDKTEKFSIRQMDYATSVDGINNYENENGFRKLTDGGNFYMSSTVMSNGLSLTDDSYMPYNENKNKRELIDILNYANSNYELSSTIMMPILSSSATKQEKNEFINAVKENIVTYGGAYVGTGAPNGNCGFENSDGKYVVVGSNSCIGSSGHAMQIIGWDDNYSYKYCKSGSKNLSTNQNGKCSSGSLVNGTGAWIVRNSWGEEHKMKYIYLGYDSYDLEIGFTTSLIDMDSRNWDNNYHKNMWSSASYSKNNITSQFNKKINTDEKVTAVKFMADSSNGEYSVTIKSGSNTYKDIKTISGEYPGIYTIDLSDKNIVLNSSNFEVSINSKNSTYIYENSISVFTSNIDKTPIISTDDIIVSTSNIGDSDYEFIIYFLTKNIPSNGEISYSLLNGETDYSGYILSVLNNKVAENNVNAIITFDKDIPAGEYTLRFTYNSNSFDTKIVFSSSSGLEGDGTESSPYLIYTEDDLNQMRYDLDAYYLLKNDITLTKDWDPIGTSIMPFSGGFDGDGHTIYGLNIEKQSDNAVGFFGYVKAKFPYEVNVPKYITCREKTYIKNVTFNDANVSNDGISGILIGKLIFDSTDNLEHGRITDSASIVINNVHFIGGKVTSYNSDAGVIAGNIDIFPGSYYRPHMDVNNMFSSVTISGYKSAGLIGYVNDSMQSAQGIRLKISLSNFENVGIIDETLFDVEFYDYKEHVNNYYNYSFVIGGLNGNMELYLENYLINSIFSDINNNARFRIEDDYLYYIGYNDKNNKINNAIKGLYYETANGYCIRKGSTLSDVKNTDFSKWTDFDTYWKIETIDGIERIPVLKNISYDYRNIDDISLKLYDEISLPDFINEKIQYISYEVVTNDNVIDIDYSYTSEEQKERHIRDDITIKALSKGVAIIHIADTYDGFEKDIKVTVTADKVAKPTITYYKNAEEDDSTYTQQVNASQSFNLKTNEFERKWYKFKEWNTMANGSGVSYSDKALISGGIDENLRLYAQWKEIEYTIKFDANGGQGKMDDLKFNMKYGQELLSANKFTRDNYVFTGWNTKKDGSGTSYINEDRLNDKNFPDDVDGVITLYAQWERDIQSITNSTTDYEVVYDGKEHTIDIDVDIDDYDIVYSTDGVNYNIDNIPKYKDVGEYKIYYKITKDGYEDLTNSNYVKIYGIKKIDDSIKVKDNTLVIKNNNDFDTLVSKIDVYATNKVFNHLNKNGLDVGNLEKIKTGDTIKININNSKDFNYTIAYLGDLNGDGNIDIGDLSKLYNYYRGNINIDGVYYIASDLNGDDSVNIGDLSKLYNYYRKNISSL